MNIVYISESCAIDLCETCFYIPPEIHHLYNYLCFSHNTGLRFKYIHTYINKPYIYIR